MSSFNSLDLFGSGPHRFTLAPQGSNVIPVFALDGASPGSVAIGPLELIITITGRLVAEGESALWSLRDDIEAQLTTPAVVASLIDHKGREWENMSFVRFEPAGPTDRGRACSLPYTARFIRFLIA
ncbi:MAG: hypothetical protein H7Y88_08320 [Phycisphaerales bacterium]|nr:hypothetical protein [Phycisphaerales bacterium]